MTKIAVVGLGYVGLPLALLIKKKGYEVVGLVKNQKKAELISNGICPFKDEKNSLLLKKYPIKATVDFKAISKADIIIICVPTPVNKNHFPNYEPVISSSKNVAKYLKKGALVILESTVNPGATETIVIPTIEKYSKLKAGRDFEISHCPERINPGDKKWNVENIPRVVGSLTKNGLERTILFYQKILKSQIKPMGSLKETEAVKIVENCFRDINIAFVNELAMSFAKLGINLINVIKGAETKPFAFLAHYPGCGVGGHCIPVDPYYLIDCAVKKGFTHNFLSLARNINNQMPEFTLSLLKKGFKKKGIRKTNAAVGVLGLSYKPNIDDCRESPAFKIIDLLKKEGIKHFIFDPYVLKQSTINSLEDILEKVNAVIITTAHDEFKKLTPEKIIKSKVKIIIDGRNCLDKESFIKAGIHYQGIGR